MSRIKCRWMTIDFFPLTGQQLKLFFIFSVHAFCVIAVNLHGRIADARYGAADRLFYCYVFSLVVLAPASLYLEEAFEALHFKPR